MFYNFMSHIDMLVKENNSNLLKERMWVGLIAFHAKLHTYIKVRIECKVRR